MKTFTLIIFLIITLTLNAQETKNWAIKNGVEFNTSIGLHYEEVGLRIPDYSWKQTSYINLKFGYRWYIKPQKKWSMGIKSSWIDFSFFELNSYDDTDQAPWTGFISSMKVKNNKLAITSFLTFGPVATYALNNKIAADIYYNLQPSYVVANDEPGFGFSNLIGSSIRIGVLNIGVEYIWGEIGLFSDMIGSAVNNIDDNESENFQKTGDVKLNNLRLVLGCKL